MAEAFNTTVLGSTIDLSNIFKLIQSFLLEGTVQEFFKT